MSPLLPGLLARGPRGVGAETLHGQAVPEVVEQQLLQWLCHRISGVAQRRVRLTGQLPGQLERARKELIRGQNLTDHAETQGLVGVDALAGEQEVATAVEAK